MAMLTYTIDTVETLHQHIWSSRTTYLANQRKKGDDNNPFLEADRREVAKREAASKRVHPTLLASTASQPSTQAGGTSTTASLFGSGTSASMFGSGPAAATATLPSPAFSGATASGSSGGLFSGTPTPVPSSGLFGASTVTLGLQTPGNAFGNPIQSSGTAAPAFGIGTTQGVCQTFSVSI
ncbi:hypothetical protein L7F22_040006 [Adiantum nelumboides]|nr:hypothetical protein [Adiantum nelumboides]